MPGIVLHTLLSERALFAWRLRPTVAPFDVSDRDQVALFFKGSIAPDMGYFPGGFPRLSTLAHDFRTADLARELVASAESAAERAFAWGWVSHVLADLLVHPFVEAACRPGSEEGDERSDPAVDLHVRHLRIELGLDARLLGRDGGSVLRAWRNLRTGPGPGFVSSAFRAVHGGEVSPAEVARSDLAITRFVPLLLRYTNLVATGARVTGATAGWLPGPAAATRSLLGSATQLPFAAAPLSPSPQLLRFTHRALRQFPPLFHHHHDTGLELLENRNLGTGLPLPEPCGAREAAQARMPVAFAASTSAD